MTTPDRVTAKSWAWPEVAVGDDLSALVVQTADLEDGDVVVLTSKAVSKAEDTGTRLPRADVVARDAVRVVARRGAMVIAETRHGLVLAAAGVDESNAPDGVVLSLPHDPDGAARRVRHDVAAALDVNVAVVVTDTAGRAWRQGQTDIAIGCAGIDPLLDLRGEPDAQGRTLQVTVAAVADEIAGLADLVKGKASGRPLAVVRGLAAFVLPRGHDGPGARTLVRGPDDDLFGLGAREAAKAAALRDDAQAMAHFARHHPGDVEPFDRLTARRDDVAAEVVLGAVAWTVCVHVREGAGDDAWLEAGRLIERAATLAAAHRLRAAPTGPIQTSREGWRAVHRTTWEIA
jgi:coenzyme F420-0:L-glutamate ligase/coenzyme F420-1:gamma-L-glutamate ligase